MRDNELDGVCVSRACRAPRSAGASTAPPHTTLVEHWNGTAWSIVPSPHAAFCVAVDRMSGPTPGALSSTEITWNGAAWSNAPGALTVGGALKGAGCASKRFCFVVGGSGIVDTQGPSAVVGRS